MLKKLSWLVLWRPTRPYRTNTPNDVLFIIGDWHAKVESQEIPGVTGNLTLEYKMKQAKASRVLLRELTGHSKHPFPTTQENTLHMDITRWSILKSGCLYFLQPKMENLYIVRKPSLGADCGSDHEVFIAKFRFKLKKVGKTTRPSKYDLNQISNDYTVELINTFNIW